jgi:hypothetical protein
VRGGASGEHGATKRAGVRTSARFCHVAAGTGLAVTRDAGEHPNGADVAGCSRVPRRGSFGTFGHFGGTTENDLDLDVCMAEHRDQRVNAESTDLASYEVTDSGLRDAACAWVKPRLK